MNAHEENRMKTITPLSAVIAASALGSRPALADRPGEHPTIVVQAAQGYDYASKFFPRPALRR